MRFFYVLGICLIFVLAVFLFKHVYNHFYRSADFPFTFPDISSNLTIENVTFLNLTETKSVFNCSSSTKLLVTVISHATDLAGRLLVRRTWGNFTLKEERRKTELRFIVGHTKENQTLEDLINEQNIFKDLVLTNIIEDYYNLSLKTLAIFCLTSKFCPNAKCVAKIDSDNVMDILEVEKMCIKNLEKPEIHGICLDTSKVQRKYLWPTKWDIPEYVYANKFWPKFCRGGNYLIFGGEKTGNKIIQGLKDYGFFNSSNKQKMPEDVLFTGIAAKNAGIERISNDRMIPCIDKFVECPFNSTKSQEKWISATLGTKNLFQFQKCTMKKHWKICVNDLRLTLKTKDSMAQPK